MVPEASGTECSPMISYDDEFSDDNVDIGGDDDTAADSAKMIFVVVILHSINSIIINNRGNEIK